MAAETYQARCACGKLCVEFSGPLLFSAICHCSLCRKCSGGPFTHMAGPKSENFKVLSGGDNVIQFSSSAEIKRVRCKDCGVNVYNETTKGFHGIPVPCIDDAYKNNKVLQSLAPTVHIYYADRVMDLKDGLPKFNAAPTQSAPDLTE